MTLGDEARVAVERLAKILCGPDSERALAHFDELVTAFARACRDDVWEDVAMKRSVAVEAAYVLAERLRRVEGGVWVVDDFPMADSFGRPVIDVPLEDRGSRRIDVFKHAMTFVESPPPRDFVALVSKLSGSG